MIMHIVVAVISLAAGIFFGMAIQTRKSTREIEVISEKCDGEIMAAMAAVSSAKGRERVAEKAIKAAKEKERIAEEIIETSKEQVRIATEEHASLLKELQTFKINLEEALRKLAKEVKKIPLNTSSFGRALKAVGDGDFSLKGDGYDFN